MELTSLPPEILHNILTALPLSALLTYARTSRDNYIAASVALTKLQISVLPRHVHGVLAFLNSDFPQAEASVYRGCDSEDNHQIIVPCEAYTSTSTNPSNRRHEYASKSPQEHRELQIAAQNVLASSILTTRMLSNLQSLSLHMYDLTSTTLTHTLATEFPRLRHLHLNFYHPYVHDTCLPAFHWRSAPKGTPAWNPLAGIGDDHQLALRLNTLESLSLERASLTPVQLTRWIRANPRLQHLSLRAVSGVDAEFLALLAQLYANTGASSNEDLAKISARSALRSLKLELCSNLSLKESSDLAPLDSLLAPSYTHAPLEHLSFRGSAGVDTELVRQACESWAVEKLTLPRAARLDLAPFAMLGDGEEVFVSASGSVTPPPAMSSGDWKAVARRGSILEVDPECL